MSVKKKLKLLDQRLTYKPFTYPWCYDEWLKHEQMHWLFSEIAMNEDVNDWKLKLTDAEKYFLTNIFRFFTQGDVDVAGGYVNNYLPIFPQPEVRMMLLGFAARENTHVAGYAHLVETLNLPESTYSEFLEYQAMKDKHDYIGTFTNTKDLKEIAKNIAVFSAFTEGLQLFSSFAMLLNFPRHGKMKGMGQIVSWSIRDEQLHTNAMIKLFRTFVEENKSIWTQELKEEIYSICQKMVELEDKFIDLSFSMGPMQNLTSDDLKKYIRYIADRRLISLGLKGFYKVKKNPLPWVEEMIDIPIHGNFFENSAIEYSKGTLSGDWGEVWAKK